MSIYIIIHSIIFPLFIEHLPNVKILLIVRDPIGGYKHLNFKVYNLTIAAVRMVSDFVHHQVNDQINQSEDINEAIRKIDLGKGSSRGMYKCKIIANNT